MLGEGRALVFHACSAGRRGVVHGSASQQRLQGNGTFPQHHLFQGDSICTKREMHNFPRWVGFVFPLSPKPLIASRFVCLFVVHKPHICFCHRKPSVKMSCFQRACLSKLDELQSSPREVQARGSGGGTECSSWSPNTLPLPFSHPFWFSCPTLKLLRLFTSDLFFSLFLKQLTPPPPARPQPNSTFSASQKRRWW